MSGWIRVKIMAQNAQRKHTQHGAIEERTIGDEFVAYDGYHLSYADLLAMQDAGQVRINDNDYDIVDVALEWSGHDAEDAYSALAAKVRAVRWVQES